MSHRPSSLQFERSPGSIEALDGLRAIAIILVLLRHTVRPFITPETEPFLSIFGWDLESFFLNGWLGVDLFFVLSGFLITHHLLKRQPDKLSLRDYGSYVISRGLRILPAYYFTIALIMSGFFIGFQVNEENFGFRLFYHALLLQDILPSNINVAFWSLGVEWKFYLIAPFVLWGLLKLKDHVKLIMTLGAIIILPLLFRSANAFQTSAHISYIDFFLQFRSPFYMCFEGLFVGVFVAYLYRRRDRFDRDRIRTPVNLLFWFGLCGILLLSVPFPLVDKGAGWFDQTVLQTLAALFWGAIVLSVLFGAGPVSLLSNTIFLPIARLSYVAYLIHMPLIPLSIATAAIIIGDSSLSPLLFVGSLVILSITTALSSTIIHFAIEKPFINLGRQLNLKST